MKTLQCNYGICTLLSQVSIDIFWRFWQYLESGTQYFTILIWTRIVTSHTENLNCDISSLENDTEMADHFMKHKFEGTTYD